MTVAYRYRQPPAPPDKLDELEQRLGRELPADYRAYLTDGDGGRLEDNDHAVKTIFGVGDVPDWANMWRKLHTYHDRVPRWLLPVAADEYGNLYCISLRDTDTGTVWFWDHETESDEDESPAEDNLIRTAATWPTFLAALHPVE